MGLKTDKVRATITALLPIKTNNSRGIGHGDLIRLAIPPRGRYQAVCESSQPGLPLAVTVGLNLTRGLALGLTNELVEFRFDERCDALAVSPKRGVEPLFRLIIEIVSPTKDGVLGDLWMVHAHNSE